MPVYDFTEIVDETIARSHPDPAACKIICKMLASNRVDVAVMKELEDSDVRSELKSGLRPLPNRYQTWPSL